jgi:hypothetical protein
LVRGAAQGGGTTNVSPAAMMAAITLAIGKSTTPLENSIIKYHSTAKLFRKMITPKKYNAQVVERDAGEDLTGIGVGLNITPRTQHPILFPIGG